MSNGLTKEHFHLRIDCARGESGTLREASQDKGKLDESRRPKPANRGRWPKARKSTE